MEPFLHKIAEEIYSKHGDNLEDICIVFPNRRAGLFLKKYLAGVINKNFWSPYIFSIEDLIYKHEPANIPGNITLIFELYESYRKYEPAETLDRFYSWGEILLDDFNEIDKNLVNADLLFKIIKEQKLIEMEFNFLEDTEKEELRKFLEAFTGRETPHKKSFIEIWEVIGKLYHDFRKKLKQKNLAYPGMLYRDLAEKLKSGYAESFEKYEKIYFVGFNNLSRAEETIIKELYEKGKAEIYFDADKYYLDDKMQEAGKFIRKIKNDLKLKDIKLESDLLSNSKKNISIFSTSLVTAQIKALCNELKILSESGNFIPEKTAVVIPEESLLLPLLNSIPESIKDVNITLGYSLRNTSFFTLLTYLKDLHANSFREGKYFKFEDVRKILNHPYLNIAEKDVRIFISDMVKDLNSNVSRDQLEKYISDELIKTIFTIPNSSMEILDYISEVLNITRAGAGKNKIHSFIEREQFFHFYRQVNLLKEVIKNTDENFDKDLLWDLIIETVKNQKIPFTGEPLKGIQILGTLETRLLDFENIFILSMNEGNFPLSKVSNSFIPYSLRKIFKLPVHDDEQCISAYIFYRLLQRAENVNLFYNSGPVSSAEEKSRFITQLELELCKKNPDVRITRKNISFKSGVNNIQELKIEKSGEMISKLMNRKFSSSALTTYVNCPLQYYFKYIANLNEPEEIEEWMDGKQFGTIFHNAMKKIYTDFEDKIITADDLENLKSSINEKLDEVFKSELKKQAGDLSGRNLIMKRILKRLITGMINIDIKNAPFKILHLEKAFDKNININGESIGLKGILDRVDDANGKIHIRDYKTGKLEPGKKKDFETYLSDIFENNNKEVIQAYFYVYLYSGKDTGDKVSVSLCSLKSLSTGFQEICREELLPEELPLYESKLKEIFTEMFNVDIPFEQTNEIKRCRYCSYKTICIRE
jgi:hypothetical protein